MKNYYIILAWFITFNLSTTIKAQNQKVLIFSKTNGFRHGSISTGVNMIKQLGIDNSFIVDTTENGSLFTSSNLQNYNAVIFLNTTGDVLNNSQQTAFEKYIQSGGGYVGIHAASDTEFNWPWYGNLVGAYFKNHPAIANATIKVSDRVHPSTKNIPASWSLTDEWYNFKSNPRGKVHVLATVDEKSYNGGSMGYDHPISWCHEYDGGRAFYTNLGHSNTTYSNPYFKKHILGAINYATQKETGTFDATINNKFDIKVIDSSPSSPLGLAILPDLRILSIERPGRVRLYNQETGTRTTAAQLNVSSSREDGLLGIVLDPNFEINKWVYLFYTPTGSIHQQYLSRFEFKNDKIDLNTEVILLKMPVQRDTCCHSGGDLEFDSDGNLYISLGDSTNPFQSNGYAPIDERSGRQNYDAQRTSANSKDFSGKVLRIKPQNNGTYTIPQGNLFSNANEGYPEIYTMGHRNPFRIALSPEKTLYIGDVGPDAGGDNGSRGPRGHDEFNRTNVAANFGWPYAVANNKAYFDYNFQSGASGSRFSLTNPVNTSSNNTGVQNLPPATPAWIWYASAASSEFPELGSGGRTAMAGAVYEYDKDSKSNVKFPEYFDNSVFLFEWSRNWIKEVKVDNTGQIIKINPFLNSVLRMRRPIDMIFGPDGALYIAEWGSGYYTDNPDDKIIKISYKPGNRSPIAAVSVNKDSGALPLTINFDAQKSSDPDGDPLTYNWDFDGDGVFDATGLTATHTYTSANSYNALLKVTDPKGLIAYATVDITAGNTAPVVKVDYPLNGGFFAWGETIGFKVSATDAEDGIIACSDIKVAPATGHDDHSHDDSAISNCLGTFSTSAHGDGADNVFYTIAGSYSDKGAGNVKSITKWSEAHLLQPKMKEAEHYTSKNGIEKEITTDPNTGNLNIKTLKNNSFISFTPMNLDAISHITFRASTDVGGYIEIRFGNENGPLVGKRLIPKTGNNIWDYFTLRIKPTVGTHELFFKFVSPNNTNPAIKLNWIEFHGRGAAREDLYASNGLIGSYYNNSNFTGTPTTIVKDPLIAFNWEEEAPISGLNTNGYSVKWEGFLKPENTGTYNLYTNHKNGSIKVTVDGVVRINKGTGGENNSSSFSLNKNTEHPIIIEYVHTSGNSGISIGWSKNNTIYKSELIKADILSVEDEYLSLKGIKIHPNPFNKEIIIEKISNHKVNSIELYNLSGALIQKLEINSDKGNQKIKTSILQSGMYFAKIKTDTGTIIKKLIKN